MVLGLIASILRETFELDKKYRAFIAEHINEFESIARPYLGKEEYGNLAGCIQKYDPSTIRLSGYNTIYRVSYNYPIVYESSTSVLEVILNRDMTISFNTDSLIIDKGSIHYSLYRKYQLGDALKRFKELILTIPKIIQEKVLKVA